jgi:hypothetical protein
LYTCMELLQWNLLGLLMYNNLKIKFKKGYSFNFLILESPFLFYFYPFINTIFCTAAFQYIFNSYFKALVLNSILCIFLCLVLVGWCFFLVMNYFPCYFLHPLIFICMWCDIVES